MDYRGTAEELQDYGRKTVKTRGRQLRSIYLERTGSSLSLSFIMRRYLGGLLGRKSMRVATASNGYILDIELVWRSESLHIKAYKKQYLTPGKGGNLEVGGEHVGKGREV